MPRTGKLLIRADAGPLIGAGHVMRCLALAQAWQDRGGSVTFACADLPRALERRLRAEDCDVVRLRSRAGSSNDAALVLELAHHLDAGIVVDGYQFSVEYQEMLYGQAKCLLVLDDNGQIGEYRADMILDQNLGAHEANYVNRTPKCRLLLGPRYVMLRREFLKAGDIGRDVPTRVRNILVTTGGADVGALGGTILAVLEDIPQPLNIRAVIGGAGSVRGSSLDMERKSHHRIQFIEDAANMAELMTWADVALSAAGSTVWELAYLGVPAIVGVVTENQREVASALERSGVVLAFDGTSRLAAQTLREAMDIVLSSRSRRQALRDAGYSLVDGEGAARVAQAVMTTSATIAHG